MDISILFFFMNFLIIQVVKSPMFADANIPNNLETACFGMMYCVAINKSEAQSVEEYFLDKGMKGDTGGGTDDSIYVYCYEITPSTNE